MRRPIAAQLASLVILALFAAVTSTPAQDLGMQNPTLFASIHRDFGVHCDWATALPKGLPCPLR
jgi:hypothetical protein